MIEGMAWISNDKDDPNPSEELEHSAAGELKPLPYLHFTVNVGHMNVVLGRDD